VAFRLRRRDRMRMWLVAHRDDPRLWAIFAAVLAAALYVFDNFDKW
jgi:hypothetical protein